MIFKTNPKNFPLPSVPTGYNVEGISATILQTPIKGSSNGIPMAFVFHKKNSDGSYTEKDSDSGVIPRLIGNEQLGYVNVCDLLSNDQQKIYDVATVFAAMYGFTLLPIEQQVFD